MKKYQLILLGGTPGEVRAPLNLLHEAMGAAWEGARLAARFAVDGESQRKGPRPRWLDAVSALDVTGLSAGSAALALDAPTFGDADPARFGDDEQLSLDGVFDTQPPRAQC